ncbi:hypothetical protein, partial [Enterovibrio norvegicus]|uniref:hypothetical protein n=1 Tax=Enterovibrio norvegicus TaxID=188144 RepID=UPI0005851461
VDSEGAKTKYRHTTNGLQLQVIQHVDDITLTTTYGYDSQNRRIWTLSEGRKTAFSYDSHNRQLQVTEENRWQETDTDGNVAQRQHDVATTYQYDANGQVLRSVEGQVIAFDKADERVLEERVTEYGYDAQGSMTHKVVKSGADWGQSLSQNLSENKSHRTTEYRYNGAG